ncbi:MULTISPECIES: alpha/beta hydrolase [Streptomyces]|uniref:alpha/beta hydrolase n=1 Tax=Streptomyces TaxID=1883 RepID=UPI001929BDE1|nr:MULTISPECIES: alpha/beta hydrolase [unclassified Streptomyces]CAD5916470.1 Lysophospholipase, alpha-beta hydrolase superfamily [Streptomyces sp. KY70]CAD5993058.1 Lysophospholipase, alpha-beta hydrolase superfamily [Streptomyces sp. KY75]
MTEHADYTDHHGPEGPAIRGTVVVVPGRGETRETYTRLGRRLAADAYRVRVVDAVHLDADDPAGSLTRFGAQVAEAVAGTAGPDGVARPVVLVGADTGAVAVAALLGSGESAAADAVVLAGLPARTAASAAWDDELDVRTFCPAHRSTLTGDSGFRRGALDEAVPEALLTAAYESEAEVPALILTGDADPLADRDALTRTAKSLPRARLSIVRDAHHDVLNDMPHRSVAAEIVTFLEALRNELVPLVTVESTAW